MKRLIEFTLAMIILILTLPFLLLIAIAVKWDLGSPIFFVQPRTGVYGSKFNIIKFRTMKTDVLNENVPNTDKMRLTKFGKFLRSTSLDELPELLNIIKGDMSFVGPRPLLAEYYNLYDSVQIKRHDVKPGITGWAQVNGRNAITWDKKFELDVWYVENRSALLDLKILLLTILRVLDRRGITDSQNISMSKFTGS